MILQRATPSFSHQIRILFIKQLDKEMNKIVKYYLDEIYLFPYFF